MYNPMLDLIEEIEDTTPLAFNILAFQEALEGDDEESARVLLEGLGELGRDPSVKSIEFSTARDLLATGLKLKVSELREAGRKMLKIALGVDEASVIKAMIASLEVVEIDAEELLA